MSDTPKVESAFVQLAIEDPGPSSVRYVAALVFDVPGDDTEGATSHVKTAIEKHLPGYPGVILQMLSLKQVNHIKQ